MANTNARRTEVRRRWRRRRRRRWRVDEWRNFCGGTFILSFSVHRVLASCAARYGDTRGRAHRTTSNLRASYRSRIAPFARYARTEAPSIAARAHIVLITHHTSRAGARRAADASSATDAHAAHHRLSVRVLTTSPIVVDVVDVRSREHTGRRPKSASPHARAPPPPPPPPPSPPSIAPRRSPPRHARTPHALCVRAHTAPRTADVAPTSRRRYPLLCSAGGVPHARRSSRDRRVGVVERADAMRAPTTFQPSRARGWSSRGIGVGIDTGGIGRAKGGGVRTTRARHDEHDPRIHREA